MKKLMLAIMLLAGNAYGELIKPNVKDYSLFEKATVKITDKDERSGGTGWILKSTLTKSFIVTNGHVCNLHKRSGSLMIRTHKGAFQAERIKYSNLHDLCLVEVFADLGVDTKIADSSPERGEKIYISGHPRLFPLMVTEGYMSNNIQVSIVTEIRQCKDNEEDQANLYCQMMGVVPIIKNYESKMTSAFIAGGNSGSAVYDSRGEVVGVVFAGSESGYSQSIIVPLEFLRNFVSSEIKQIDWVHISVAREASIKITQSNNKSVLKTIANKNKNLVYPAIEDSLTRIVTNEIKKGE